MPDSSFNKILIFVSILFGLTACGKFQGSVGFEGIEKTNRSEESKESHSSSDSQGPTGEEGDYIGLPIEPPNSMPPIEPSKEALCRIDFSSGAWHEVVIDESGCLQACETHIKNNPHTGISCKWDGVAINDDQVDERLCHISLENGGSHKVMLAKGKCENLCQTYESNNPHTGMVCFWDNAAFYETAANGKLCHIKFASGASHQVVFGQNDCINLCNTYKSNNPTSSFTCLWDGAEVGRN